MGLSNYLYDGRSLLEELDQSGNVLARYTQNKRIDEPLAELRSGTTSYYDADAGCSRSLRSAILAALPPGDTGVAKSPQCVIPRHWIDPPAIRS